MGTYQPKLADVVRVRGDYRGALKDTHMALIGVVQSPASLEPHLQTERNTWLISFAGGGAGWAYHAESIEPLPVGTRIRDTPSVTFDMLGDYEGLDEAATANGGQPVLRIKWDIAGFNHARFATCESLRLALRLPTETERTKPKPEPTQKHFINGGASCREIAWLLFVTDPRVMAFVGRKAERSEGVLQAMKIAWGRDEQGWRTEYEARAVEMSAIEIQRGSPWALPGSWEVCTCPVEETPTGFKVTGYSTTCAAHSWQHPRFRG